MEHRKATGSMHLGKTNNLSNNSKYSNILITNRIANIIIGIL